MQCYPIYYSLQVDYLTEKEKKKETLRETLEPGQGPFSGDKSPVKMRT